MAYILDRSGAFIKMDWNYDPNINIEAKENAIQSLNKLGIKDYTITQVAPALFWYSTSEKEHNVCDYITGSYIKY